MIYHWSFPIRHLSFLDDSALTYRCLHTSETTGIGYWENIICHGSVATSSVLRENVSRRRVQAVALRCPSSGSAIVTESLRIGKGLARVDDGLLAASTQEIGNIRGLV